jgi:hypothetical protein
MMRAAKLGAVLMLGSLGLVPMAVSAQQAGGAGGFIGVGLERNEIATAPGAVSRENASVTGASLTLGYGFTPTWALYAHVGKGNFVTSAGDQTWAGSFGIGVRAHLRAIGPTVVPFLQAGIANRVLSRDFAFLGNTEATMSSRYLPSAGAGVNLRVLPSLALSGSTLWSAGSFSDAAGRSFRVTKPLLHLGVVFSPRQ